MVSLKDKKNIKEINKRIRAIATSGAIMQTITDKKYGITTIKRIKLKKEQWNWIKI